MSKSKNTVAAKEPVRTASLPPQSPFSKFSKFGGQSFGQINKSGPTPRNVSIRPTFVTQHKGGGGGK